MFCYILFLFHIADNEAPLVDGNSAAGVHDTRSWLLSGGVAAFAAVRDILVLSFVCWILASAQLLKQLRLSQHLYPRSRGVFHSFVEVLLFGITPLYVNSNQDYDNNVSQAEEQTFIDAAKDIVRACKSKSTFIRRWMGKFGAMPIVCCVLWEKLNPYETMPDGVHKKHLLWGLYFLKVYDTEENSAENVGRVDEKTYRLWSFRFVKAISYLESTVVRLLSCFVSNLGHIRTCLPLNSLNTFKDTLE